MQKIVIKKDYKSYQKDMVVTVENNTAFSLIDSGVAVLYKAKYRNKMSVPYKSNKKRKYEVK